MSQSFEDFAFMNIPDKNGDTALHAAAFHGNHSCLLVLLQYGAPPTLPNNKKLTPIDIARRKGYEACQKTLLEYKLHHQSDFDSVFFLESVKVSNGNGSGDNYKAIDP